MDKEVRSFLSKARGRDNASYPYNYLEMSDAVFGKEDSTIEVCSGMIRKYRHTSCYTVDINRKLIPILLIMVKSYLLYRTTDLTGG
jgi:hypothetical protein